MPNAVSKCIAERRLLYSSKRGTERIPFVIRVFEPHRVEQNEVSFPVDGDTACCILEFYGLPEAVEDQIFGADSLQALQLAVNVDPVLKRLTEKYDFYFPSGEGYFDD